MPYVAASARRKIWRAKEHFNQLHGKIGSFCTPDAYEIRAEFDPKSGQRAIVWYATKEIPTDWSLWLGELFYNLRSALDHVVHDLGPFDYSEFPIITDPKRWGAKNRKTGEPAWATGLYKLQKVTIPAVVTLIESAQPFNTPKEQDRHSVLWLLDRLCNIDKHRTLHLCRRQTDKFTFTPSEPLAPETHIFLRYSLVLDDRTELAYYTPLDPDHVVDVKAEVAFNVALDEGQLPELAGEPVLKVCRSVIDYVERLVGFIERLVP